MPSNAEFAEWLTEEMKKRRLTIRGLAEKAGVAHSSISRAVDPNPDKPIGLNVATSIAHALGLPQETVLRRAGLLERKPATSHDKIFLEHVYDKLEAVGREQELISYADYLLLQISPPEEQS